MMVSAHCNHQMSKFPWNSAMNTNMSQQLRTKLEVWRLQFQGRLVSREEKFGTSASLDSRMAGYDFLLTVL